MKLSRCGVCKRPLELYTPTPISKEQWKSSQSNMKMVQGPSIQPRVKKWCMGRCDGLMADMWILVSEILNYVPKKEKKLRLWAEDYQQDINRDFVKLIRGLANGRKEC